jgi:hypothetical protein
MGMLVEAAHLRAYKLEALLEATKNLGFVEKASYDEKSGLNCKRPKQWQLEGIKTAKGRNLGCTWKCFLMAEAREVLGIDKPRDSAVISELAGARVQHSQNFGSSSVSDNDATKYCLYVTVH